MSTPKDSTHFQNHRVSPSSQWRVRPFKTKS
uniref:Uncharacterized protein n=1 Tax=Anguilla anguilla TaxID=7936 RepID=A0A0E9UTZ2_ANGAN